MELVKFDAARRALAEARSVDEVKAIRDKFEAFRVYSKQAGESLEMQNWCAEIKLRAERRAGELLREMPKDSGGGDTSGPYRVKGPQTPKTLGDLGISHIQSHRWQKLASIPKKTFDQHIEKTKKSDQELTTVGTLRAAKMEIHYSSKTPEWQTPGHIIQMVLDVLGHIDLDPCADSDKHIPAKRHLTKEDDGLSHKWRGKVYMNPPYGSGIDTWVEALASQYEAEQVEEAIALVPARTDTKWFLRLRLYVRCFVAGRLRFGSAENAAPFPSMAVYLGKNESKFISVFSGVGDSYELREV